MAAAGWHLACPSRVVAAVLILGLLWMGQFVLVSPWTGSLASGRADTDHDVPLLDPSPLPALGHLAVPVRVAWSSALPPAESRPDPAGRPRRAPRAPPGA